MKDIRQLTGVSALTMRVVGGVLVACALVTTVGLGSAQAATSTEQEPRAVAVSTVAAPFSATQLAATVAADPTLTAGKAGGEIGIMAEGGFDRDHWWFKISRTELISIGAGAACAAVFRGPLGAVVCPPLVGALNWLVSRFPVANGFWVEVYTNGRVNAGTW